MKTLSGDVFESEDMFNEDTNIPVILGSTCIQKIVELLCPLHRIEISYLLSLQLWKFLNTSHSDLETIEYLHHRQGDLFH